jgi:hypothetical protein
MDNSQDEQDLIDMKYHMNMIIFRILDSKRLAELSCALQNFDQMIVFYEDIIISVYNMCIYEFANTLNIREFIYTNEFILSKEFKNFQKYFDNYNFIQIK